MQFVMPTQSLPRSSAVSIRFQGLDTLRGLAAVLVVFLHAGIPYMTKPLPHLAWPARDVHPSSVVDALTWCAECFLMPLFFVLAGFFSERLLHSRGEGHFLRGRTKRLLPTQLAAGLVILPVCLCIWSLGWVADGLYVPQDFLNTGLPPELEADLYGSGHFWFMQHLHIYCLILCGASWLAKRVRRSSTSATNHSPAFSRGLDRALVSVWKPLLPAIPCAVILYWDPRIVLGFYQTFLPVPSKLAYYAVYFFVGAMLDRHHETFHLHARFGRTYLLVAGLLFAAALPLIHEQTTEALSGLRLALLASLLALFAWCATFGLIAIFLRTRRGSNAATRYLAEASFWIYLIHLPIVVLAQITFAQLPIPAVGKFLLAGTTATVMALMTYRVFVRHTWLGEFLDGHRHPRKPATADPNQACNPFPSAPPGNVFTDRASRSSERVVDRQAHQG